MRSGGSEGSSAPCSMVAVRSFHPDSARKAREAYFRALESEEAAIVDSAIAMHHPVAERRREALASLKDRPDSLAAVAAGSEHPDTRRSAQEMLRA